MKMSNELEEEIEISAEEIERVLKNMDDEPQYPEVWGPTTLRYFGPKTRAILVTGAIDEQRSNAICSQIQELHMDSPTAPIYVHINTPGGSVIDALAIYDMLLCMDNPIITLVNGGCFSAGMLIACAGDQRLATPNSMYFHHQPEISVIGITSQETMESNAEFYKWCKYNNDEIMRKRIGMSEEDWALHFGETNSKYFGVKDAIKYGFCTATLVYADKPKIELITTEEES